MHVEVRPVWSKLVGADAAVLAHLDDLFKIKVPGARYMPSVRAGHWDGYVRYFKPVSGLFMSGLLPEVLLALEDLGTSAKIVRLYEMPKPGKPLATAEEFTPRDYQEDIVREAMKLRRGVIKAATNAGKTEIAMMLCQRLGLPTLYVVTEQTLWAQTYDRFVRRFGTKVVGRIGAGHWEPKLLTIAMAQSVAPKLGLFVGRSTVFEKNMPQRPQVIIADEVHLFTGNKKRAARGPDTPRRARPMSQWQLILEKIPAPYRFGMSGTPLTEVDTRDRNLIGLTGPMLSEVSNRELVEMGFSAVPRITFVRYPGASKKISWDDAYRELVVQNDRRNDAVAELCDIHRDKQVLVLCNWAQHALRIKLALNAADVTSVFLSGRDPVDARQKWLREFSAKHIQVIVATTIFDQGVDVPAIDVLIMAGAMGMSPIKPLQRLGRGLRKRPDKDEVLVYDFEDRYQEDTEKHSRRRMQLFKRERFVVQIKTIEEIREENG